MELELREGVDRLPELIRIALFRILQESLTNVHRHCGSPSVEVRLKVSNDRCLRYEILDEESAQLLQQSETNRKHFGVGPSGMRERVTDLGGTFEIQASGNGTLITVSIPLATEASESGTTARNKVAKDCNRAILIQDYEIPPMYQFGTQSRRFSNDFGFNCAAVLRSPWS